MAVESQKKSQKFQRMPAPAAAAVAAAAAAAAATTKEEGEGAPAVVLGASLPHSTWAPLLKDEHVLAGLALHGVPFSLLLLLLLQLNCKRQRSQRWFLALPHQ